MTFEQALEKFRSAMESKFRLREAKYKTNSAIHKTTSTILDFNGDDLWMHFDSEYRELMECPTDQSEMVDVANMLFLIWWQEEAKKGTS